MDKSKPYHQKLSAPAVGVWQEAVDDYLDTDLNIFSPA